MARGDKPYRVYRGGRARGSVPLQRRPSRASGRDGHRAAGRVSRAPAAPRPRRRRRWGRRLWLTLLLLVVLLVVWLVASYLALSAGVQDANERLGPAPVHGDSGLILSKPTTFLLLGTDFGPGLGREGSRRADSIMLVRTEPRRGRISYLSIPRDLRVDVPGRGPNKINAAFQFGGAPLAIRTVEGFTGIEVDHLVVVDFQDFEQLIDAVGGITVDVPEPIVSNPFECPYASKERCERWRGWRFDKGPQTMDGQRALVYSRIRVNQLNASENDLTRGERQQAVLRALGDKVTSPTTLVKLPFIGSDLVEPLATDLTAGQLLQLGWLKFRADDDRTLRCRLGGYGQSIGGTSYVVADEETRNVVLMFVGAAAPQPPRPDAGPLGSGCVVGR